MKRILLLIFALSTHFCVIAQFSISGVVRNAETRELISGVTVTIDGLDRKTSTNDKGAFNIRSLSPGKYILTFGTDEYEEHVEEVTIEKSDETIGYIELKFKADNSIAQSDIATITLSDSDESGSSSANQTVAGILNGSRDPFMNAAAFNFSAARFRIRGYDNESAVVLFNGVPFNDLDDERVDFNTWGGLNDVTRNQQNSIGLQATSYTFGSINGSTFIDTRASRQRKQLRVGYALSNRSYSNRIMATYNTGMLNNGWAFSFSGSRRWATEGFIPGTFYDGWSYFASVDKKISSSQMLNLTIVGSQFRRGKSSPAVTEMVDLAGDKLYNPAWGYQNGDKRNSRVERVHQPLFVLRHDWNINDHATLTTAASYQFGRNGQTALDWYNARDPRPDYYLYLPSFISDSITEVNQHDQVLDLMRKDENLRQLDWDYFYNVNRNNTETIENANGSGSAVTGKRSQYVLVERRQDSKDANFYSNYQHHFNKNFTLDAGVSYRTSNIHYFNQLNDLLGGEFIVDIDKFAERDFPGDNQILQNDLSTPNKIIKKGDTYGVDYLAHIRKAGGWAQGTLALRKFDIFGAAEVGNTQMWREGKLQNGKYPDNSLGNSEKLSYLNYSGKAGVTYKINGRNYLYVNGGYIQKAPLFSNVFVASRVRDLVAENHASEKITSGEVGYNLRSPFVKLRLSAYYTLINDRMDNTSFYHEELQSFVNFTMTGINQQYAGTELGVESKLFAGLSAQAVANVGQYLYTNRPTVTITVDNNPTIKEQRTVYLKNFYVAGTPQNVYSFTLKYTGKQFWFANLSFNYFDQMWMEFNPDRRTNTAVTSNAFGTADIIKGSTQWYDIINQQQLPNAYTLDFFGGKSYKFGKNYLYLNVGVNNILDNQFITGAFEQLRFDYTNKNINKFPPKYFYHQGINYFINLTYKL